MTPSKSQTLITGVYRTGTEFLSGLLNQSPDISVTMYSVNVLRFIFRKYDPIWKESQYTSALNDLANRIKVRYQRILNKEEIIIQLQKMGKFGYGIFYDVVMNSLYLKNGETHWAEKNQLLWREIPQFLEMMPNGKAIHIYRDPRSVLLSFRHITYTEPPAYLGAIFNCYDSMRHVDTYQKELPSDRYRSIKYEDLARNPQEKTNELFEFLGLKAGNDVIDQTTFMDGYGNPWESNSAFEKNSNPDEFDVEASIFRWKEKLSAEEIQLTEGVCSPLMESFGYPLTYKKIDWLNVLPLFIEDDKILDHFKKWLLSGQGIEAFPTDPLDPKNWVDETGKRPVDSKSSS
jgi:hypothetical protein